LCQQLITGTLGDLCLILAVSLPRQHLLVTCCAGNESHAALVLDYGLLGGGAIP